MEFIHFCLALSLMLIFHVWIDLEISLHIISIISQTQNASVRLRVQSLQDTQHLLRLQNVYIGIGHIDLNQISEYAHRPQFYTPPVVKLTGSFKTEISLSKGRGDGDGMIRMIAPPLWTQELFLNILLSAAASGGLGRPSSPSTALCRGERPQTI